MDIIVTVIVSYLIASLFGYVLHRSLHRKWAGTLYVSHMRHHVDLYPSSVLVSKTYRSAGSDSARFPFMALGAPLLVMPFVIWHVGLMTGIQCVAAVTTIFLVGVMNDVIHDAFHLENHLVHRMPGYRRMRDLHFVHHDKMTTNMGIFWFAWDRLFGTFREISIRKLRHNQCHS